MKLACGTEHPSTCRFGVLQNVARRSSRKALDVSTNRSTNRQDTHVTVRLPASLVERIRSRSPSRNLSDGVRRVAGAGLVHTKPVPQVVSAAKSKPTAEELAGARDLVMTMAERLGVTPEEALAMLDERRDAVFALLAGKPSETDADAADVAELTRLFETNLVAAGAPKGSATTTRAHALASEHLAAKRAARKGRR